MGVANSYPNASILSIKRASKPNSRNVKLIDYPTKVVKAVHNYKTLLQAPQIQSVKIAASITFG